MTGLREEQRIASRSLLEAGASMDELPSNADDALDALVQELDELDKALPVRRSAGVALERWLADLTA
jgi:hypothetical protein